MKTKSQDKNQNKEDLRREESRRSRICCSYALFGYECDDAGGVDRKDQGAKIVDSGQNTGKKKDFIRIFKDATPENLWNSYCMGLGLDASDESLKSFKVYIDSPKDVQPDEYTIDGDLIN